MALKDARAGYGRHSKSSGYRLVLLRKVFSDKPSVLVMIACTLDKDYVVRPYGGSTAGVEFYPVSMVIYRRYRGR